VKSHDAIGLALLSTTAITTIVGSGTAGRVYHGLRPSTSTLPAINYFKLSGNRHYGMESEIYSINCRAATASAAMELARQVKELWGGSEGMTTYGIWGTAPTTFDFSRASITDQGLIPEPDEQTFNAPLDLQIVYRVETVS
jgi:hypothetical protein